VVIDDASRETRAGETAAKTADVLVKDAMGAERSAVGLVTPQGIDDPVSGNHATWCRGKGRKQPGLLALDLDLAASPGGATPMGIDAYTLGVPYRLAMGT